MITRQTIDTIFSAARVEEVIGDFVHLKRAGGNLKGLSPFVDEKSPSFMVSPAKQIWKDFSSGKGGNVVTFLMEHEQFTYPEALRWLAKRYNIEIEEDREQSDEQKEEVKLRESLYIVSEFAKKYFVEQLNETEEGKNIGLSYFKERGFTKETILKFELGYSPAQRNAFTEYAEKKGYSKALLEASGLSVFNEQGNGIDRFRERVMFPIHSFSGRVLGFGGRILRSDAKAAKYLNSPETEIYHKSKILYGIFQSKQAILKQNECLLVEGYTDVISLHQSGIENVVSSSGTALTPDQIRLIKRLTPNVTILYDGDSAGIKASFRGIDLILEQELNVKVLLFPEGNDPDSFAQKHSSEEIQNYIAENATDFIQFKAKILLEDAKNDPVKKADLIRDIIQSISLVPNMIQRELYIQETSKLMDVREEVLFKELAQILQRKGKEDVPAQRESKPLEVVKEVEKVVIDPINIVEEEIIKLIMQFGNLVIELTADDDEKYETTVIEEIIRQFEVNDLQLKNELYQSILEDVKLGYEQEELRAGDFFIKLFDESKTSVASEAMIEKYSISKNWADKMGIYIKPKEDHIVKDITDTILRYKSFYLDEKIKEFSFILKDENITGELRIEQIEKIMILTQMRSKIFVALNRVI
ncbi:DNA primase [Moheibacter sediminis]|uniref:DNA primase n=1 Tax=Moheibacter sediminis TaxID=1434700 RepID=A0A1W2CI97_9FLAO|nr:DNA primase [Moheibacter sediminis]SMC84766.1 DNA primase [Moheibacter sediminis]